MKTAKCISERACVCVDYMTLLENWGKKKEIICEHLMKQIRSHVQIAHFGYQQT